MIERFRRALACMLIVALVLCAPLKATAATGKGGFESWWNGLSPTVRDVLVLGAVLGAVGAYAVLVGNPATLPVAVMIGKGALGFGAGAVVGALLALAKNALFGGSRTSAMSGNGGPTLLGIGSR